MDRNETIGVKTTLANGRVERTIDGMTKRVVDIAAQHQDAAVRAALTQLGWTPPEESEELRRDAERYRYIRRPDAWKEQYISVRGGISAVYVSDGRIGHAAHGDALDAAIDSAKGVGS